MAIDRDDIPEITPEMIEAGAKVYYANTVDDPSATYVRETVREIFTAMSLNAPLRSRVTNR